MRPKNDEHKGRDKERQGEFFAEFQAQSSRRPHYFFRRDIALGKKVTLNLSYENLFLFFIVVIMLLVVFFSLGVEKGKKATLSHAEAEAYLRPHKRVEIEETTAEIAGEATAAAIDKNDESMVSATGEIIEKKESYVPVKPYTIQVIAFKKEENAVKEVRDLKKDGYEAFILPSKGWFQICVGRYTSRDESEEDLDLLKKRYPTCYFRKID